MVRAYPPKKYNNKRKNQVILLMITDGKEWHYLAIKKFVSVTYRNHNGYFYCLNHSYSTEKKT